MPTKDLILTKMEAPSRRDFASEALAARKRRRKKLVNFSLFALLMACWLIPIFPERLPDGVWQEADFESVQPNLEKAVNDVRFDNGYDFSRYTLKVDTGYTTMKRSLLGRRSGSSGSSGVGYTYVIPEGLSFLEYDHASRTAKLLPEHYDEFMDWCEVESRRQDQATKNNQQNKAEMATPRKPSD